MLPNLNQLALVSTGGNLSNAQWPEDEVCAICTFPLARPSEDDRYKWPFENDAGGFTAVACIRGHAFHKGCLRFMQRFNRKDCPECRSPIFKEVLTDVSRPSTGEHAERERREAQERADARLVEQQRERVRRERERVEREQEVAERRRRTPGSSSAGAGSSSSGGTPMIVDDDDEEEEEGEESAEEANRRRAEAAARMQAIRDRRERAAQHAYMAMDVLSQEQRARIEAYTDGDLEEYLAERQQEREGAPPTEPGPWRMVHWRFWFKGQNVGNLSRHLKRAFLHMMTTLQRYGGGLTTIEPADWEGVRFQDFFYYATPGGRDLVTSVHAFVVLPAAHEAQAVRFVDWARDYIATHGFSMLMKRMHEVDGAFGGTDWGCEGDQPRIVRQQSVRHFLDQLATVPSIETRPALRGNWDAIPPFRFLPIAGNVYYPVMLPWTDYAGRSEYAEQSTAQPSASGLTAPRRAANWMWEEAMAEMNEPPDGGLNQVVIRFRFWLKGVMTSAEIPRIEYEMTRNFDTWMNANLFGPPRPPGGYGNRLDVNIRPEQLTSIVRAGDPNSVQNRQADRAVVRCEFVLKLDNQRATRFLALVAERLDTRQNGSNWPTLAGEMFEFASIRAAEGRDEPRTRLNALVDPPQPSMSASEFATWSPWRRFPARQVFRSLGA